LPLAYAPVMASVTVSLRQHSRLVQQNRELRNDRRG
jgi:hypothetical protein